MMEPRPSPYIWTTWLAADLAGDDQCRWKPWLKAHYKYDKRQEDVESENRLARWKADHGAAVRERADELMREGWRLFLEGQNKFHVRGVHATVGGAADILAIGGAEPPDPVTGTRAVNLFDDDVAGTAPEGVGLVEDVKTGARRESDYWQVVVYACMLPIAFKERLEGIELTGRVVYGGPRNDGSVRDVHPTAGDRKRVYARIREIATSPEPPRTPSPSECRFCDILGCPDRMQAGDEPIETEEF